MCVGQLLERQVEARQTQKQKHSRQQTAGTNAGAGTLETVLRSRSVVDAYI